MDLNPAFDDTMTFIKREYRLILPIAVGTIGLSVLLLGMVLPASNTHGMIEPGPWMWWLIPVAIVSGIGRLGLAALKLLPGLSVGEAMALGARNVAALIAVMAAMFFLTIIAISILAIIMMALLASPPNAASVQALILSLPLMLLIGARLALVESALVDRHPGETLFAPVVRAFRLTKGYSWRIALIMMAAGIVYILLLFTVTAVFGSIFMLLGRLVGDPAIGEILTRLMTALFISAFFASFAILMASVYQRLSGRSNGI